VVEDETASGDSRNHTGGNRGDLRWYQLQLSAKDNVKTGEQKLHLRPWELANTLCEQRLVEGHDL
jgi:hypothetical protein